MKMFYSIRHTFLTIWQIPWPSAVSCGITLSSKSKHPWLISGIDFHSTMIMSCSFGCQVSYLLVQIVSQLLRLSVNSFSVNSSDCQSTVFQSTVQIVSQQFRLSVNSFSVNSSDCQSTVQIVSQQLQLSTVINFFHFFLF